MAEKIDLDRLVDYKAEYTAVIEHAQIYGSNLVGRCPFHQDAKNSFSADLENGKWHCFTEDIGGNFLKFWAKYHHDNDDTKTAYREILEKYGVSREPPSKAKNAKKKSDSGGNLEPYTLEQYSRDKGLPADFLTDVCKVTTGERKDGTAYLKIAYLREDGQPPIYRQRYAHKEFRWGYGAKGAIRLYGEWRLPEFREQGWILLVEGESDAQSLWYMGLPGIGVAGAVNFKPEYVGQLHGITKIYIHQEPDGGGAKFVEKVCRCLTEKGYAGEVYIWECKSLGEKDPSDLFLKRGRDEARRLIYDALQALAPADMNKIIMPEAIPGAPLNLRIPPKWFYSDDGVFKITERDDVMICRTPIILTRRLENIVTREEKIEVAFKRDGRWTHAAYERDTIFKSQNITILSKLGCTITSENAKKVVAFLGELEAENIDLIPKVEATSVFGWQPGNRFIPGYDEGITLDIDPQIAAGFVQSGTMEEWIEAMRPHRQRDKFRFILAAGFAAPLLRIVKQRSFFVFNWGSSKGGKTAALEAALSAWGDPEQIMVSFNATQVGLERKAEIYCDLPLGIDERQQAGDNQELISKLVYMISGGMGKIRGNKTGGLQVTRQWRTVALATGEQPLSTATTQTGVSTRALEIYGAPFDSETDASEMYHQVALHHGHAGPAFIRKILQTPESGIVKAYESMREYVRGISSGKNGSHIAGIALVALADAMLDNWLFGGEWQDSWAAAQRMAENILVNQVEANASDVNENAVQFLVDWVLSNKPFFSGNDICPDYGHFDESGNTVYILPSMFNQAIEEKGKFPSARKVANYLAEQGLIGTSVDKKTGKKKNSVTKWRKGRNVRFIEFYMGKISERRDETSDTAWGQGNAAPMPTWYQQTLSESTEDDSDLPF